MTPARTKQFLRYGITVDLVILATGIGWLFPEVPLAALVGVFAVATALAGLRAAWEGIALAMVLSAASLYFAFHATPLHLAACAIASVILGAIVRLAAGDSRARVLQPVSSTGLGDAPANVVSFDSERAAAAAQREQERAAERATREREEAERAAAEKLTAEQREREALEARLAAERAEAERIAREREALEARLAAERAEAERIAREREELERAAAEKLAAEQREREALEQRLAAERAEAERVAREREELERATVEKLAAEQREREALEARLAAERAEAERIAREREELERAAAEKLAAEQREREALEQRLAAERAEAEARIAREREEAERAAAEKLAAEQREREALEARLAAERAEAERIAREREELEQRLAAERAEAEARIAREREEAERAAAEKLAAEAERIAREREEHERAASEKLAAEQREREALEQRLAAERAETEARIARERAEAERVIAEKLAAEQRERELLEQQLIEQRAAAENAQRELEERIARERQDTAEREALERLVEQQRAAVTAARDEAESRITERLAEAAREADVQRTREREQLEREMRGELERRLHESAPAAPAKPASTGVARKQSSTGLLSTISGWFRKSPESSSTSVNLRTKKVAGNTTATRRAAAATSSASTTKRGKATRKPRILLLEKRRGTADTIVPKLRHRGIEVQVVERWIDAVDELFRFRPDAFFLDSELPDFDRVYKAVTEHGQNMPLLLTGRHASSAPAVRFAQFVTRPYDIDEVSRIAQEAMNDSSALLAKQTMPPRTAAKPVETPARITPPPPIPRPAPAAQPVQPQVVMPNGTATDSEYSVVCFNCRVAFDANDADWCSCLTKERTLVCTNCLMCFCKAAPAYKEKFWVEAPPRLFERKTAELRRQQTELTPNVQPDQVRRPLVLLVEDDEDIQVIVQRVCSNLGYGFVGATNGQDGLAIARQYRPNLILSDAFMPKLDGREMCRILKEEPGGADCKMVVMTGLYTDTKYKSEALKRFHIDDYLSKPVAITDLINLMQRHLEGVSGLPQQEDLHELHRKAIEEHVGAEELGGNDIALSELLDAPEAASASDEEPDFPDVDLETAQPMHVASERRSTSDSYEVCCFSCNKMFDATRAEWCTCLGRDQTLVCSECGSCFCRAPSIYKERFWVDAPSTLFERKMIGSKRNVAMHGSPDPAELRRPLILLVEDDENIQLIVKTVVTTMGYGFIAGANGQEGLTLAREYNPDLILSDAFMPKLDGREMCRLLKEDPSTARAKAIIMTGLYTDRKYRAEALSYFKVDDYVAKPLAVDDLIKLMKKHLPQDAQPTM